jgi:hypothetical protein
MRIGFMPVRKGEVVCRVRRLLIAVCVVLASASAVRAGWRAAQGPLITRWAKDISPQRVHPEYPRPQMVRKEWLNLNGLWEYAMRAKDGPQPMTFDGEILVPFAVESALSGVMKPIGRDDWLWYRRTFRLPGEWRGRRVLLHFGAVDWEASVWVNGRGFGSHQGGYDGFTFDITEALKDGGQQEIVVCVWDPTDADYQPRGKQVMQPKEIWYTAVTGIWQTVWLEPVGQAYIKAFKVVPDIDARQVHISADCAAQPGCILEAHVKAGWLTVAKGSTEAGSEIVIAIPKPKPWSPDSPFLYELNLTLKDPQSNPADTINSYFGMRKISLGKDENGITRIMLNNSFVFQYGPLDQGWWPDGLYTPPTDEALRYDLQVTKKLGFNMLRKHVKVEPSRFYYWCDRLGLLVWQDMPSGDHYLQPDEPDQQRTEQSARQFELELKRVIDALANHPCVVMWVLFNEGWGQYDTQRLTEWVKRYDPTHLVDSASGWADRGCSDVYDVHHYPGPCAPLPEPGRAAVLGEFGGLGLRVKGHMWQPGESWGYRDYQNRRHLTDGYVALVEQLRPLVSWPGLSAAVYTQTTDVEIEVNGLMTYDRRIIKMDSNKIAAANRRLYKPPLAAQIVMPDSQQQVSEWRYTTSAPGECWQQPDFDDSSWPQGPAGFGSGYTPSVAARTVWDGSDIWLRRRFKLKSMEFGRAYLWIYHDEDAEVYINGRPAAKCPGYTTNYVLIGIEEAAKRSLRAGDNLVAVHCHQTEGGQYIDAGIVGLHASRSKMQDAK